MKSKCHNTDCTGWLRRFREDHHYRECGLDDIWLRNVLVHRCTNCKGVWVDIPRPAQIHRDIAIGLLCKDSLTPQERTFLVKYFSDSA